MNFDVALAKDVAPDENKSVGIVNKLIRLSFPFLIFSGVMKKRVNSGKKLELSESYGPKNGLSHIKSQDPQNIQTLVSFENELASRRSKYLNNLIESISQIQNKLGNLKVEVRNDFAMELRGADYYRINMFDLEAKISEAKGNIKNELCSLLKQESELNKELQMTERRVQDWGRPLNPQIFKPAVNNSVYKIQSKQTKNNATSEMEKFLSSSGGRCGGWEELNHSLFLWERKKHKLKSKFILSVRKLLPGISREEIEAHEKWYEKYEELKNLEKEAFKERRARKSAVGAPEPVKQPKDAGMMDNVAYRRDIAEKIKEWKRKQRIKQAEDEEREKRKQQILAGEKMRKQEIQKAKKLAVEKYKAEKIQKIQDDLMELQKVKEFQNIEDKARKNVLLKDFREQDKQYIERIRALRMQSASKAKDKLENVKPSIEIVVERDRGRLLQPTQVWNQHCLPQENDNRKSSKIMNLQTIPHLAIPSWRKGLSNI